MLIRVRGRFVAILAKCRWPRRAETPSRSRFFFRLAHEPGLFDHDAHDIRRLPRKLSWKSSLVMAVPLLAGACHEQERLRRGAFSQEPEAAAANVAQPVGESGRLYFSSQGEADESLARFDRAHPQCQLWTNWQKMCSRTGPGGETLCRTTAQSHVRPSTPFCVARQDGGYRRPRLEEGDMAVRSSLRFCRFSNGRPATLPEQIEACEYVPTRPFGGHDLRDREHPWCEVWHEAGQVRPARIGRSPPYGFFCSARRVPEWCSWPDGLGNGPDLSAQRAEAGSETIPVLLNPDSIAVRGIFCRRRTN